MSTASDFSIVEPLFLVIDSVTRTFVTEFSSKSIAAATPVVTSAMTLSIILYGLLVVRGVIKMPVIEFIGRSLRIAIIISVATAGGLYQSHIADVIMSTPDDLALALVPSAESGESAANVIDKAAGEGAMFVSDAFEKASFFSGDGLVYVMIGIISTLSIAAVVGIGAVFVIVAKAALAILVGIGPFFIFALLFEPTKRFFEMWASQIMNYVLMIVLFTPIFGLMINIFGKYMSGMTLDGVNNVGFMLVGMLIVGVVSVGLLLQIPSISSGLAGGVGLSFYHELRALSAGAGMAKGAAKKTGNMLYSGGKTNPDGSRGQSRGALPVAYRGGQKAVGYFKGKKSA